MTFLLKLHIINRVLYPYLFDKEMDGVIKYDAEDDWLQIRREAIFCFITIAFLFMCFVY